MGFTRRFFYARLITMNLDRKRYKQENLLLVKAGFLYGINLVLFCFRCRMKNHRRHRQLWQLQSLRCIRNVFQLLPGLL